MAKKQMGIHNIMKFPNLKYSGSVTLGLIIDLSFYQKKKNFS